MSSCLLFGNACMCLQGFDISFSWDLPINWCLKDVQEAIVHILDAKDKSKPDTETLINAIKSSVSGVTFPKPNPVTDVIPCEMSLKACFMQFRITNVLVISEAKHIELYVNDMYHSTSKGNLSDMVNDGRGSMFENHFDTAPDEEAQKLLLKFLSLANKESMKIQGIVLTIIMCSNTSVPKNVLSSADVNSVRHMINSMDVDVGSDAEKLMKNIESHQLSQNQQLFQKLLQGGNISYPDQGTLSSKCGAYQDSVPHQLGINQNFLSQLAQFENVLSTLSGLNTLSTLDSPNKVRKPKLDQRHEDVDESNSICTSNVTAQQPMLEQKIDLSKACANSYNNGNINHHTYYNDTEKHDSTRSNSKHAGMNVGNVGASCDDIARCKECGCGGCGIILNNLSKSLILMEQNLRSHIDVKIEELRHHLDKRLDEIGR